MLDRFKKKEKSGPDDVTEETKSEIDKEVQEVIKMEKARRNSEEKDSKIVLCQCLKQKIDPTDKEEPCSYCGGTIG